MERQVPPPPERVPQFRGQLAVCVVGLADVGNSVGDVVGRWVGLVVVLSEDGDAVGNVVGRVALGVVGAVGCTVVNRVGDVVGGTVGLNEGGTVGTEVVLGEDVGVAVISSHSSSSRSPLGVISDVVPLRGRIWNRRTTFRPELETPTLLTSTRSTGTPNCRPSRSRVLMAPTWSKSLYRRDIVSEYSGGAPVPVSSA